MSSTIWGNIIWAAACCLIAWPLSTLMLRIDRERGYVMRHIRKLVYRLGFRPELGSIFHSPTEHWRLLGREAIRSVKLSMIAHHSNNRVSMSELERMANYHAPFLNPARFCPLCGNRLQPDWSCREGHGSSYIEHDNQGIPVLAFRVEKEPWETKK